MVGSVREVFGLVRGRRGGRIRRGFGGMIKVKTVVKRKEGGIGS